MNQLGLKTTRPYRNIWIIDSRVIKVCGLTKDLKVYLASYHDISIRMDVVVIDVPDSWGMLFSRKWVAKLGASIQMDLSYATIPTSDGTFVTLCRHLALRHQVEYHKIPLNELVWEYQDFGDLGFITNSIVSMEGEGHYGNKAFKDIKEPIILAFVPINLDYFQDCHFSIFI